MAESDIFVQFKSGHLSDRYANTAGNGLPPQDDENDLVLLEFSQDAEGSYTTIFRRPLESSHHFDIDLVKDKRYNMLWAVG
jgi:hypothetical protein